MTKAEKIDDIIRMLQDIERIRAAKAEKESIRNDYSNKYSEALLDIRNNVK